MNIEVHEQKSEYTVKLRDNEKSCRKILTYKECCLALPRKSKEMFGNHRGVPVLASSNMSSLDSKNDNTRGYLLITFSTGTENFCKNIESMIGHRPNLYFRVCWKFLSPVIILVRNTLQL